MVSGASSVVRGTLYGNGTNLPFKVGCQSETWA